MVISLEMEVETQRATQATEVVEDTTFHPVGYPTEHMAMMIPCKGMPTVDLQFDLVQIHEYSEHQWPRQ